MAFGNKPSMPPPPPSRSESSKNSSFSPINLPHKQKLPQKPTPKTPPPPKDFTRSKVREKFRKVENTFQIKMQREERVKMEKELFPFDPYGYTISRKKEIDHRIKKLKQERFKTPHTADKLEIDRKINLLKKLQDGKK